MAVFILLKSSVGKFGSLDRMQPLSDLAIDAGSLWQEIRDGRDVQMVFQKFRRIAGQDGTRAFASIEERSLYMIGYPEIVAMIPDQWIGMLLAVPDMKERLRLFRSENILHHASRLSVGDLVSVQLTNGRVIPGTLRYIGPTSLSSRGDYFGVEVPPGCGVSDGHCSGVRYFQSYPNSALFVPVTMLWFPPAPPPPPLLFPPLAMSRVYVDSNEYGQQAAGDVQKRIDVSYSEPSTKRSSWLVDLKSPKERLASELLPKIDGKISRELRKRQNQLDGTIIDQSPLASASPSLAIGERVVYARDGAMEYGTVKWIGKIPGSHEVHAGVEFDNAVGNGTGSYNGSKLFKTSPNHAGIMPVSGLMRACDFEKDTTDFGSVQKNLLVEFEGMNDTSVWSTDKAETSSDSPSPPFLDTSGEDLEAQVRKLLAMGPQLQVFVGDHVEVLLDVNITTPPLVYYGTVRWIGKLPGTNETTMVGVELEKDLPYWIRCATDGTYQAKRYFTCGARRGVFVSSEKLRVVNTQVDDVAGRKVHGAPLNDSMPKFPEPWKINGARDIRAFVGTLKGIQGKSNSCYLDATLFAMFAGTGAYDGILSRPRKPKDIELYDEIRTCLKFLIVSPLRWTGFVEQDAVMKLRRMIAYALPSGMNKGWTDDEKDPEELINALFGPILSVDPDIHLSTGQSSHICQLVIDDAWAKTTLTSVQTLLERSFFCSNVLLKSMPERFIVQLPRYGKQKLYNYIVPTLNLDLSNILANRGRICGTCGEAAQWQCKECYLIETSEYGMTFFCNLCFGKFHSALRTNNDHKPTSIAKPVGPIDVKTPPTLELASVICIESSHYVSFVRIPDYRDGRWFFFDSMADREGGDVTGRNIPQVIACDEYFDQLLRPQNRHLLVGALPEPFGLHKVSHSPSRHRRTSNPLPPFIERLMQDCYICIYDRPHD